MFKRNPHSHLREAIREMVDLTYKYGLFIRGILLSAEEASSASIYLDDDIFIIDPKISFEYWTGCMAKNNACLRICIWITNICGFLISVSHVGKKKSYLLIHIHVSRKCKKNPACVTEQLHSTWQHLWIPGQNSRHISMRFVWIVKVSKFAPSVMLGYKKG